jgi:hypothetical protein
MTHSSSPNERSAPLAEPTEAELSRSTDRLARQLGQLRQVRPEYQQALQTRLLAQLATDRQPWWRRRPTWPLGRGWRLAGLASAAGLLLALLAGQNLLAPSQEVSAAQIYERAQALAANPFDGKLKSFHLTAHSSGRLPLVDQQVDGNSEQWFSAESNRWRGEQRETSADGQVRVSGALISGKTITTYASPGGQGGTLIGITPGPGVMVFHDERSGPNGPSGEGAPPGGDGAVGTKEVREERKVQVQCAEPTKKGETTIAGRGAYLLESGPDACKSLGDPAAPRGRHVMAVDKETYLPLRMEQYDANDKLAFRYEVTKVDYDTPIADEVFSKVPPAGTVVLRTEQFPDDGPLAPHPKPLPR